MIYTHTAIDQIKGVGPRTAEKLTQIGIATIGDLIYFFPRKYEDFSRLIPIKDISPGNVTVCATVEKVQARYIRRKLHITEAILDDGTSKTKAIWFNQPYRAEQLKKEGSFYFAGEYTMMRNTYAISNPAVEQVSDTTTNTAKIIPIYPELKGITSAKIRQLLKEVRPVIHFLAEELPVGLLKHEQLMERSEALEELHFPTSTEQLEQARFRLAFEELLELFVASRLNKREHAALPAHSISFKQDVAQAFVSALPFQLTAPQKRAAWEMFQELESGHPMNRLLQGDVGSGKTVVAAFLAFMAAQSGYQTAFMAPTEILAAQHAETIVRLLEPFNVSVALLTGSLKAAAKKTLQSHIAKGDASVIIGTHALIQKDSIFHNLGLVIIDEQHRFGVEQRAELLKKSKPLNDRPALPHLLSMTATPIPRSLQLTLYGDLNVSILDELPKGRQPIQTELYSGYGRAEVYKRIDEQIELGHQAYVVCPMIGESKAQEIKNVEEEYAHLKKDVFAHRRLGLLHGQLSAPDKDEVMHLFKAGKIDILVCTTVIEVGVDVPNATVMLIEGAERFGLAQLHQLRGRVGRGSSKSYCFLLPSVGVKPSPRLHELEKSQDGFHLAEVDLELRGPGQIYGRAQHGSLDLKIATITDTKLLKRVQDAAEWLLSSRINLLEYKEMMKRVAHYRSVTTLN